MVARWEAHRHRILGPHGPHLGCGDGGGTAGVHRSRGLGHVRRVVAGREAHRLVRRIGYGADLAGGHRRRGVSLCSTRHRVHQQVVAGRQPGHRRRVVSGARDPARVAQHRGPGGLCPGALRPARAERRGARPIRPACAVAAHHDIAAGDLTDRHPLAMHLPDHRAFPHGEFCPAVSGEFYPATGTSARHRFQKWETGTLTPMSAG